MMDNSPQQELQAMCRQWSADLNAIDGREGRMAYVRAELPELLSKRWIFEGILRGIQAGSPYPDLRQETLFDNELILFRDPGHRFSLRLYVFGPGEHTAVHDHTSWGVSGAAFGPLEVVRYRREGAGSQPGSCGLTVAERRVLGAGEIETTLPFADGIHRRLYIECFDLENGRVERRYSPHIKKRILAQQALQAIAAARQPAG